MFYLLLIHINKSQFVLYLKITEPLPLLSIWFKLLGEKCYTDGVGFEPTRPVKDDRLVICCNSHSANHPTNLFCYFFVKIFKFTCFKINQPAPSANWNANCSARRIMTACRSSSACLKKRMAARFCWTKLPNWRWACR